MRIGKNHRCWIVLHKGNEFIMPQIGIRIGALDISIGWDPKIKREEIEE